MWEKAEERERVEEKSKRTEKVEKSQNVLQAAEGLKVGSLKRRVQSYLVG